jgi:hypothetical protein
MIRGICLRHEFYKTPIFKKRASELRAWTYVDALKLVLDTDPEAGALIRGGDGIRKIRIALEGRGKRGGGRVV